MISKNLSVIKSEASSKNRIICENTLMHLKASLKRNKKKSVNISNSQSINMKCLEELSLKIGPLRRKLKMTWSAVYASDMLHQLVSSVENVIL